MQWVCYNGQWVPADQPLFTAQNRSFRYGDGVFETARFFQSRLPLWPLHAERLWSSLRLLQIDVPEGLTTERLLEEITALCAKNNCAEAARVRLAVFRGEHNQAEYVIEATALENPSYHWNNQGWTLDIYPHARKSCDAFANVKSANYLPYVLAGRYATEKGVDECLVLNAYNKISDGSKTNLFLWRNGEIFTPALNQGCVSGVMRRYVIEELKKAGYAVHQSEIEEVDLQKADEIFMTNALIGLQWVRRFQEREYGCAETNKVFKTLFHSFLI